MNRVSSILLLAVVLASSSGSASAQVLATTDGAGLRHWWNRVHSDVDALIDAHRLVPPTPVELRWRARRIWSGVLPGDVLDLASTDLGADHQDELLVLTSQSVLVFSRRRGLFDVRTQANLPSVPASLRSRDPMGVLAIGPAPSPSGELQVRARSSEQGAGASYAWRAGALEQVSEFSGFPLCEEGSLESAPGRNFFLGTSLIWPTSSAPVSAPISAPMSAPSLSPTLYSARCTRGMVDSTGAGVRYQSEVSTAGELHVRCEGSPTACQPVEVSYPGVGYAHLVVDLDRDGHAEVVTTSPAARGDRDRLQVFSQVAGEQRLIFEREFERGIVALSAGDFDGDGALELLAAERESAAGKVKLWLLN